MSAMAVEAPQPELAAAAVLGGGALDRRQQRGEFLVHGGDQGEAVESLQTILAAYGYGLPRTGIFDRATEDVVAAFQRHFRPERVDGAPDQGTLARLDGLLALLGDA